MKKNKVLKTNIAIFAFTCFCGIFMSCRSIPTESTVSQDLTPSEINQLAQGELDSGYTKHALAYYNILISRYGGDSSTRTGAEYEIAHILIKQKKWLEADSMLQTIIKRYESAGGAGISPKFYILTKNDYAKTQEYIKRKNLNKKEAKANTSVKYKTHETNDSIFQLEPKNPSSEPAGNTQTEDGKEVSTENTDSASKAENSSTDNGNTKSATPSEN